MFRRSISKSGSAALGLTGVLMILVVWMLAARWNSAGESFFPGPMKTLSAAYALFVQQSFLADVGASAARIGVAFAMSAVLAIPLGIMMSSFRSLGAFLTPFIDFIRYVPVPALLPIFVLSFGIGETPKLLVLFFGTFFQLVLLVIDDADGVTDLKFDTARTLGASTPSLLRDVLLPAMLPRLYDNLRITLGWCWTYLVIAELIAVKTGMGHVIKEAQRYNAADVLIVACVTMGLIGLLTDLVLRWLHGILFPYVPRASVQ